jgi:hypothetical protein
LLEHQQPGSLWLDAEPEQIVGVNFIPDQNFEVDKTFLWVETAKKLFLILLKSITFGNYSFIWCYFCVKYNELEKFIA